jgi:hypothetical protein
MRTRTLAGLLIMAMAVPTADAGDLDPPGPPAPTMRTLDDLGALSESIEGLLLDHVQPGDPGDLCEIAQCPPGGTCPQVSITTPIGAGGKFFKGCSEAEAKRKLHAALRGVCQAAHPCNGTCDGPGEACTLYVSSLSYDLVCAPATVAACGPNDDPHICVALPKTNGEIRCACVCAL